MKLSDKINRKFTEQFDVNDWQVESHDGWRDITKTNKTVKYRLYEVHLQNGLKIKCADDHILITNDFQEVFAKNSLGKILNTKKGDSKVTKVIDLGYSEEMYDLSVSGDNLYYTNDILSHNTVTVGNYLLWRAMFHDTAINIGIVANKPSTAREVLDKIKKVFLELPIWLMNGISVWNKSNIEFENGTRIMTDSPSSDSFRGYTCVSPDTTVEVINKKTLKEEKITIKELYERTVNY